MMSSLLVVIVIAAFLMVHSTGIVSAQDDLRINADSVHLKFENDRVRVLESILQPSGKEKMHSHPSMVVYVIKGGKIRNHSADGKITETKLKAGDVTYRDPVTQWGENIGASEIDEILVEVKSPVPHYRPNQSMKPRAPHAEVTQSAWFWGDKLDLTAATSRTLRAIPSLSRCSAPCSAAPAVNFLRPSLVLSLRSLNMAATD